MLARGEDWVVVGKPSGLVVHRSDMGNERRAALQLVRNQIGQYVHPVHRIDRGTSGCLLFALRTEAIAPLVEVLRAGTKQYIALVRGNIQTRDPITLERPMTSSRGQLQDACTTMVPIAGSPDPRCSLVLATPETGRYHQVRRHVRDLSHPVLGDSTHGDTRENRVWRETWGLNRLALHCLSLELAVPEGKLRIVCPVPDDLRGILRQMPWWAEAVAQLPDLAQTWPGAPA